MERENKVVHISTPIGKLMDRIEEHLYRRPAPPIAVLPKTDFIPAHVPPLVAAMRHAAFQAKDRGATVELTTRGLLVRSPRKCELIPWSDVELVGIIDRALNRVAPHDWELD